MAEIGDELSRPRYEKTSSPQPDGVAGARWDAAGFSSCAAAPRRSRILSCSQPTASGSTARSACQSDSDRTTVSVRDVALEPRWVIPRNCKGGDSCGACRKNSWKSSAGEINRGLGGSGVRGLERPVVSRGNQPVGSAAVASEYHRLLRTREPPSPRTAAFKTPFPPASGRGRRPPPARPAVSADPAFQ
jgi:hypothetical protein